jgi:oxygen-independent coproporphyrinogen-3 oxidase
MKSHQKLIDEATLPDAAERIRQAAVAREILERGGYVEIGIDHFALPGDPLTVAQAEGRLRRNFQGYTDDGAATLIGIGASSISRTPWGYAQNAPDNHGWRRAIEAGRLPTVRGKALAGDDRLRAEVVEELLCRFEVDLAVVAARHGRDTGGFDDDLRQLAPLVRAGWVAAAGGHVRILQHRHEIARVVAAAFDAYLGRGGRHSAAV